MSRTRTASRRNFLLAVGAGGAATAAAVAATIAGGKGAVAKKTQTGDARRDGKGYEETAHVRNYYRTTRV